MRLTLKLALALVTLVLVVLAAEASLRLRDERAELVREIEREQALLGLALHPAVEAIWAKDGLEAARRWLAEAEASEEEVSLRLVELEVPGDRVEIDAGQVRTWLEVEGPGGEVRALELSESLRGVEAKLTASAWRLLVAAVVLLGVSGVAALVLGHWMVGRPIQRLRGITEHIARGEWRRPEGLGWDELGALGASIHNMVDGLERAQEQVGVEAEARLEAERALRRTERLATVGTLAAGLAHELGTPLQVITGRARMIARVGSEDVVRHAEIVREQTERMNRIVRELLDFARAPSEAPQRLEVGPWLEEVVSWLRPVVEEAGRRLEGEGGAGVVEAEVHGLGQVVNNLVRNAVDASPEGGVVRLRASVVEAEAPAGVDAAARWVCVEVDDDGEGVAEEDRERVFDPFFTTKPVGEGTGLGLSVAHGRVRDHGGWIELAARVPRGTRVRVLLPEAS